LPVVIRQSSLVLLSALATPLLAQPPAPRLIVLGTGNPNPDPERSGPAVAVVVGTQAYLVDAGAGVVRRAVAAARRHELPALRSRNLDIVFLTHLHSDHTIGLPDLVHTGWVAGERQGPLRVYGPPGTAAMAQHLTEAWRADIAVRTRGRQPHTEDGWRVEPHEIEQAGVVYQDSAVVVTAFRVPHPDWEVSYGYRFDGGGWSIVISGDTGPSDAIVEACRGCDVLVHEVYDAERYRTLPPEWRRYHGVAHTSTVELAQLAQRARPGLLVLYHQLSWGGSDDDLLRQVRAAGYGGPVASARDLDLWQVGAAPRREDSQPKR
jgi:ribonuclease BN (tRNA processing enzyme)